MPDTERKNLILNLQKVILSTEDNSTLLNSLLTQILTELAKEGLDYETIGLFLIDLNAKVNKSLFVYKTGISSSPLFENGFGSPFLFVPGNVYSALGTKLLQGQSVFLPDIRICTYPNTFNTNAIKSLIALPVIVGGKVVGIVTFGIPRVSNEVSLGEMGTLEVITNLIGMGFRLQDTQVSLTKITQEVYKMNAQLHQLDKLKDDFVSIASHELRTPMTAIRSYVWMAINRSDIPLSDRLKRYLERTLLSTERLINLVNDMLNISRIESGRIEIKPTSFALPTLINDIIFEVDAKAKERGIVVAATQNQIPNVFADADKVHQILLNLVGNSMKFTPTGGRIDVILFSDGKTIDISVKDSGVGISKEDLYKLFTKFGRLDNSYVAAATSGGTGLGLYICKSLAELMGGKIKASSEGLGKGTTFTLSLPVATPSVIAEAAKLKIPPSPDARELVPEIV